MWQNKKTILLIVLASLICIALFYAVQQSQTANNVNNNVNQDDTLNLINTQQQYEEVTKEQAIEIFLEIGQYMFKMDIDKNNLSVSYVTEGSTNAHAIWLISNDECACNVDVASGLVVLFQYQKEYTGKDKITHDEFQVVAEEIANNPDEYFRASTEIVNAYLADGQQISEVRLAGIMFTGDKESTGTISVDCSVLMESGRCYTFSFEGQEMELKNFYSYPTMDAYLAGYFWEDDASDQP